MQYGIYCLAVALIYVIGGLQICIHCTISYTIIVRINFILEIYIELYIFLFVSHCIHPYSEVASGTFNLGPECKLHVTHVTASTADS